MGEPVNLGKLVNANKWLRTEVLKRIDPRGHMARWKDNC